jgi:DNA-binding NarL/FixJ family response regulator
MAACIREGANGYVLKPAGLDALGEAITNLGRYWLEVNIAPGQS